MDRVLRDHSKPCGHDMGAWREWDEQGEGFVWQCTTISCPGGREVTIDYEAARMVLQPADEADRPYFAARAKAIVDAALGVEV